MIAITVSVNYSDLLDIVLPNNQKFFERWYIVTDINDKDTIDVINRHGFPNVVILYYNFTESGRTFNKGGAIAHAMSQVNEGEMLLLVDSDIFITDEFAKFANYAYEDNVLYSFARYDYYTREHFEQDKHDHIYHINFMGFFQLFRHNNRYRYYDSDNCRQCDSDFACSFPKTFLLETSEKVVKHLGRDNVNHFGRKNTNDYV